jgi:hypothetical protein
MEGREKIQKGRKGRKRAAAKRAWRLPDSADVSRSGIKSLRRGQFSPTREVVAMCYQILEMFVGLQSFSYMLFSKLLVNCFLTENSINLCSCDELHLFYTVLENID